MPIKVCSIPNIVILVFRQIPTLNETVINNSWRNKIQTNSRKRINTFKIATSVIKVVENKKTSNQEYATFKMLSRLFIKFNKTVCLPFTGLLTDWIYITCLVDTRNQGYHHSHPRAVLKRCMVKNCLYRRKYKWFRITALKFICSFICPVKKNKLYPKKC